MASIAIGFRATVCSDLDTHEVKDSLIEKWLMGSSAIGLRPTVCNGRKSIGFWNTPAQS
jgi:hypothetical protein